MQLHDVAIFGFDINIQTSPRLQPVQILSVTPLELSGFSKDLKESVRVRLDQIFGFGCVPDFDQAFVQFFPSTFVLEHFSLEKTSIRLMEAGLRPKVLKGHYLKTTNGRYRYLPVCRNWY